MLDYEKHLKFDDYEKGRQAGVEEVIRRLSEMKKDCKDHYESLIYTIDRSDLDMDTINKMDMALHMEMGIDACMVESELILFSSKLTAKELFDKGVL
jgi:hypothetical protein